MPRALLPLLVVCGLLLAPAAHAGTPFTVGEGKAPHLIVDAAGTAHVTWHDDTNTIFYCQVPRGATACAAATSFDSGAEADDTFLVAADGALHIVMADSVAGKTFVWKSTDNGALWSVRGTMYGWGGGTDPTEPVTGPQ